MTHTTTALVPLQAPGRGKTRLAAVLTPAQRSALAVAMVGDVIAAVDEAGVAEVVLVAADETAAAVGRRLGVAVVTDPPGARGLDAALAAAGRHLGGSHDLLVVAADLPRLAPDDVRAVLESDAEVVIAPTAAGGTGGLLRRPGNVIGTHYGTDSAERHRAAAAAMGARSALVERRGWYHDVDTFSDLVGLLVTELGARTAEVLPLLLPARPRHPVA